MRDQTQQESESLSWTLETDTRTTIAYPRIVALARSRPVDAVNRALTALHGRTIRLTLDHERSVEEFLDVAAKKDLKPGWSVHQQAIKVTYASENYLSIVELGTNTTEGSLTLPFARAVMIDIERGAIFSIKACDSDNKRATFIFGDLLSMCTDSALTAFFDLWEAHAVTLATEVPHGVLPCDLERCRQHPLAYRDHASFSLYLTNAGLAVHNVRFISNSENQCVDDAYNPFNPVIIPYRKLEPLMQPGPLRDELLATAGRKELP